MMMQGHDPAGAGEEKRGVSNRPAGMEAAAELLRALANSHRLAIVQELGGGGSRCVHELVDALGVSQPLVSQHLKVLRSLHLVRAERRGREIAYSLGDDHVTRIVHDAITHAGERRLHPELLTTEEP